MSIKSLFTIFLTLIATFASVNVSLDYDYSYSKTVKSSFGGLISETTTKINRDEMLKASDVTVNEGLTIVSGGIHRMDRPQSERQMGCRLWYGKVLGTNGYGVIRPQKMTNKSVIYEPY